MRCGESAFSRTAKVMSVGLARKTPTSPRLFDKAARKASRRIAVQPYFCAATPTLTMKRQASSNEALVAEQDGASVLCFTQKKARSRMPSTRISFVVGSLAGLTTYWSSGVICRKSVTS